MNAVISLLNRNRFEKVELQVEVERKKEEWTLGFVVDIEGQCLEVILDTVNGFIAESFELSKTRVRLPPSNSVTKIIYEDHDPVEVMLLGADRTRTWKSAVYRITAEGRFVQLSDGQLLQTDTVVLRTKNMNDIIPADAFVRFDLEIPETIRPMMKREFINDGYALLVGADFHLYDENKNCLRLIAGPKNGGTLASKVRGTYGSHFSFLQRKFIKEQKIDCAKNDLQAYESFDSQTLKFGRNELHLYKLAIGGGGRTINEARKITGIQRITATNADLTISIIGTKEAVQKASLLLNYQERNIDVPSYYMPKLIGKNGNKIKDIVKQSGVHSCDSKTHNQDPALTTITFFGTQAQLDFAESYLKLLLDQIRELTELDSVRDNVNNKISEKIRNNIQRNASTDSSSTAWTSSASNSTVSTSAASIRIRNASTDSSSTARTSSASNSTVSTSAASTRIRNASTDSSSTARTSSASNSTVSTSAASIRISNVHSTSSPAFNTRSRRRILLDPPSTGAAKKPRKE